MNKIRLLCAAAAIVAPTALYAQETTSTFRGTVAAQGSPVAGAEVVIVHQPTGTTSTAVTNSEGAFIVTGQRLGGPFLVRVTAPGYQTFQIDDVFASGADSIRLPIELAAEGAAEIVVTGTRLGTAGRQTLSPTTTLSRDDIEGVATVNRDVRDLVRRSPFAQLDPTNSRATSIAGQNSRFNRFSVNGVQFSDDFGLNNGGLPTSRGPVPLDAICSFSVEVAPVDIREGDFQGGAINTQLCSGSNTPSGGVFYTYSDDNLSGSSVAGASTPQSFTSEAYGAYLRGPIIRDRLFFAFAWERTAESEPAIIGPSGAGFAPENSVPGVTNATIALIQSILDQSYGGYNAGNVPLSVPENDDRVTARIDWNINDNHTLALTYIYNNGSQAVSASSSTNQNTPRLALSSNSYTLAEEVHSGVVQLNSRWTDSFSTEARVSYRDYVRGQTPPNGRDFGQFQICLDEVSTGSLTGCSPRVATIQLGPDGPRQANELNTENLDAQLTANLLVGNHNIRFLAQYTHVDVYNLFVNPAAGLFYFDSLADFRAGRANQFTLRQSTTGDLEDAAAAFNYSNFTFGIQDTWDISDTLTVIAGVRYEWYDQGIVPTLNPFFTSRYGFTNQATMNGRDIILPRFGISWRPMDRLSVRASFGRYAGGAPDVWMANSYSNTGIASNSVQFTRNTSALGCAAATGVTADICAAALNNVYGAGPGVPQSVRDYIAQSQGALSLAEVNALDPNFELPNQWRFAGTVSYNADLGGLGDDWFFAVDALYGWVDQAADYIDIRSVRVGTAPDGRPRYAPVTAATTSPDMLLTNTDEGRSLILVGRVAKEWTNGLSFDAAYTFQDITDRSPLTSSQAFSSYRQQATADPNGSTLGISAEQIRHSVRWNIGYRREFFRDAETRIQLFGEWRQGRPYSYTFDANPGSGRDPVFGVLGDDFRHLLYVPTGTNDPLVSYDSDATRDALDAFINSNALARYRGQIAAKNIARNDDVWRLDLHVSQEIPLPGRFGRLQVYADMENVLNFINDEWGVLRQFGFPPVQSVVDVSCAQFQGTNCVRYNYSNFRNQLAQPGGGANFNTGASLWGVRLGVRYRF